MLGSAWWQGMLSLSLQPQHPVWALVSVLAAPHSAQLAVCGLGRQPKSWSPYAHGGHLEGTRGSWLQISLALAVTGICGVNQQLEDFSVSLSL